MTPVPDDAESGSFRQLGKEKLPPANLYGLSDTDAEQGLRHRREDSQPTRLPLQNFS